MSPPSNTPSPEANCKPDFIYHNNHKIAVFCDGSAHDSPEQRRRDAIDRDNLQYEAGYSVMTFSYNTDLDTRLQELSVLLG